MRPSFRDPTLLDAYYAEVKPRGMMDTCAERTDVEALRVLPT